MKRIITLFITIGVLLGSILAISLTISNRTTEVADTGEEYVIPEKEEEKIPDPVDGGTLKIAVNNPDILHPLFTKDQSVKQLLNLVFDSLVKLDKEEKPVFSLAESIENGVDGTYITVKLRADATWQDGSKLTSADVAYTIDQIKAKNETNVSPYLKDVQNIGYYKILDEKTIQLNLKQPHSGYLYSLTFPIVKANSSMDDLVGIGPYVFKEYIPMQSIVLEKNMNWFKGKSYIDKVEATVTRAGDDEAKLTSFEAGLIQSVHVPNVDWGKFSSNVNWTINEYVTYYYDFIGINFNNEKLQNRDLRQGMMMAIDRKAIVKEALIGHGIITETPLHPNSWLNNKDESGLAIYDVNLEKSKELIGTEEGLAFELIVPNNEPNRIQIAEAIKINLANVGITLTVSPVEPSLFAERVKAGNYDLFYGGWHLSKVPDLTFAYGSSGAGNYINYNNSTMDELLYNTFNAVGDEALKSSYSDLIKFIEMEVPYLSLFFRTNTVMTDKSVYGKIEPTESDIYRTIDRWYLPQKNEGQ